MPLLQRDSVEYTYVNDKNHRIRFKATPNEIILAVGRANSCGEKNAIHFNRSEFVSYLRKINTLCHFVEQDTLTLD